MNLNDMYRVIVMQDVSIAGDGRSFRILLDDTPVGTLTGQGYLTTNTVTGRHTLALRNGNITVFEKNFVVTEDQHITRAFVRKGAGGRTEISFDAGADDREVAQEEATKPKPKIKPRPAERPAPSRSQAERQRREAAAREEPSRGSIVLGYFLTALVSFATGIVVTWLFFRF